MSENILFKAKLIEFFSNFLFLSSKNKSILEILNKCLNNRNNT